ncbi:MAG TPA: helix-turn-helix domain-containing protein [Muribaculaceae bacterium]|nr:helix-turn-helix domain-containing protein [Muribaculaceae bacterium]
MEENIRISDIASIREHSSMFSRMEDDYIFSRGTFNDLSTDVPARFNGLTMYLCRSGKARLEVNMAEYELAPKSLTIITPGQLVSCGQMDINGDTLFISIDFLKDINIDLNAVTSPPLLKNHISPVMPLSDNEFDLIARYFELLHSNAVNNTTQLYARNIGRTLIAATIYQILQFVDSRRAEENALVGSGTTTLSTRRMSYVHEFGRLVHKYFRKERSVAFYADKLFISPKYLSLLVKEATGRSAANWIDEYVIMEAKNMLRFSGRNIQQVTYDLNFPNQSSFGKYFKHLTGMSPTQYQRS